MDKYSHLITIEEINGQPVIRIDIVPEVGYKYFSSEIQLPENTGENKWDLFDEVACRLGKTICIDSPEIRKYFNIEGSEQTK